MLIIKIVDDYMLQPILQSTMAEVQQAGQNTASTSADALMQSFQSIMMAMLTGGSDSNSFESLAALAPMLQNINEQLLSLQVQSDLQGQSLFDFSVVTPNLLGQGKYVHVNQFDAEMQVGGDGVNSNCGPASLVMALHKLGLGVAGETASTGAGQAVDLARRSMAGSSALDGVSASGARAEAEHNLFTDFDDLARGATAAGARSQPISPDASSIVRSLQQGHAVIVSGTFVGKSPLPWTGDRGADDKSAPGNATQHIVEVSSYNGATGLFTINDPARNHANLVSAADLENFMSGNAGAIAIWR
jgi:hypothetical protein